MEPNEKPASEAKATGHGRRVGASIDKSIGYCLACGEQLTQCGKPFSGEFSCRCGALNVYEESQQPTRLVS